MAERLGWKLQAKPRKPRGYWDSLDNVKQEVDEFIQDNELLPGMSRELRVAVFVYLAE